MTTTAYGSWLPGDARGYVRDGIVLPGDTNLQESSRRKINSAPVRFSLPERDVLLEALVSSCHEFEYGLSDVCVESWHLHWIVTHDPDMAGKVVGRLKTRMRQALHRGRIWTTGYCAEPLFDDESIENAKQYIARHPGCRMIDGELSSSIPPAEPGAVELNP